MNKERRKKTKKNKGGKSEEESEERINSVKKGNGNEISKEMQLKPSVRFSFIDFFSTATLLRKFFERS